ncbi:MAG: hypothetical protein EBR33_09230 [Synechococcaceae bacterium WB4_1_0192]|nr:hypothetical protein [Synechococcaceae bacterium WB4_1_0192]
MKDQPVSKVRWVPREKLIGNAWNPNHVAAPELELLITSLVEDGWTQPVVVLPWIDCSPGQNLTAVCKATPGTTVLMPWQDAVASPRPFVPRFDD